MTAGLKGSSARPHVMHVLAHLDLGGSEEVALALTERLRNVCDFSVFAVLGIEDTPVGRHMWARLQRLHVPVYCGTPLDMKRGGMLHAGWRLRQVIKRVRPDILHLHTDVPDGAYAASRLFGRDAPGLRVVRTIHNTVLWPKWQRVGGWVERRLEDTEVVAVSPASLDGLHAFRARQGLRRLSGEQCRIVYNGVAECPPRPARRPGPARVLFAGRLEPQKGADLLPDIVARAAALTDVDAEVTVLGHGALGGELKRWAGAKERRRWPVTLLPPVPQLAARLAEYDLLLMPSRFEGLALTAIEALMAGTPVLASEIDGLRELFPPNYRLLAKPEDVDEFAWKLAAAVQRPDALVDEAATLVAQTEQRFGLERVAQAYGGLYHGESPIFHSRPGMEGEAAPA